MNETLILKMSELKAVSSSGNQFFTYEGLAVTFSFSPPITEFEKNELISYFNSLLPLDYFFFLEYSNGCTLFNFEDLGGLEFFGCNRIIDENDFQRNNYDEDWDKNVIIFCSCLGEGNFLGFRILAENNYKILDCFHEQLPKEWVTIGDNLDEFIEKYIDSKGKKFWL